MMNKFIGIFLSALILLSGIASLQAADYSSQQKESKDNKPLGFTIIPPEAGEWHCKTVDPDGTGHDCTWSEDLVIEEDED